MRNVVVLFSACTCHKDVEKFKSVVLPWDHARNAETPVNIGIPVPSSKAEHEQGFSLNDLYLSAWC